MRSFLLTHSIQQPQGNARALTAAIKHSRTLVGLAALGLFIIFPLLFSNPTITTIAVFALIFAGAALGWNIFSGFTGYISLGHAAFFGIGAYILALLCRLWNIPGGIIPFLLLPVVGLLTGVCSLLLGWIALKTRHYAFLVITIAMFSLSAQLPNFLSGFISGINELSLPLPSWSEDVYNIFFYYIALLLLLIALCVAWWIRHSHYGLNLLAIRDDELRAEGLGLRVGLLKLSAFMISAFFVGLAGAMTVYFIGFISPPSAFDRSLNLAIPLMVLVGGSGTIWGPVLGAIIVVVFQQCLTLQFGTQNWDLILYGALLLVILLLMPIGILPTLARRLTIHKNTANNTIRMEAWNEDNREESSPVLYTNQPVTPAWGIRHMVAQELLASDLAQSRLSGPLPAFIPHRNSSSPTPKGLTQKVRAQRLISLPSRLPASSPALPGPEVTPLPLVGWPCPRCNEPLLAWGDMHFCTRCGLKLPRIHRQIIGSNAERPVEQRPRRPYPVRGSND